MTSAMTTVAGPLRPASYAPAVGWFGQGSGDGAVVDEVGRALVERWRQGDETAFSDLFRTYRALVHGVLHHLLAGDPELEDVVQAAFLEVFRSLDRFEGRSRLSSWIARVALHVGYHHLRRKKSRPPAYAGDIDDQLPDLSADPHGTAERRELIERVRLLLAKLPEKKRTVLLLNDLQGVPQEEIAEICGTNVATVRTRLFYARKELWALAAQDPVLSRLSVSEYGPGGAQTTKR